MSPRLAVYVLCLAALSGCADLDAPPDADAVLVLTATPQALPANGFATATIVAEIDHRTAERFRDIAFKTTLGRFPAGTSSSATTILVAANDDGRATVTLQSAASAGVATVTAEIRDGDAVKVSREITVAFDAVPASQVITLDAGRFEAPADGASVTELVARIDPDVPPAQRVVSFTTTLGGLGSPNVTTAQVVANSTNEARIGLISPRDTGTATVTASINGLAVRGNVVFTDALPDRMSVRVLGAFRVAASFATKVTLSASLFRDTGTVSRGTDVTFETVDDSSGHAFGFFSAVTPSDVSGNVAAEFTPGNTVERGVATITARVRGSNVTSSVKIEVVDP
jgi:hypothetical protein